MFDRPWIGELTAILNELDRLHDAYGVHAVLTFAGIVENTPAGVEIGNVSVISKYRDEIELAILSAAILTVNDPDQDSGDLKGQVLQ